MHFLYILYINIAIYIVLFYIEKYSFVQFRAIFNKLSIKKIRSHKSALIIFYIQF